MGVLPSYHPFLDGFSMKEASGKKSLVARHVVPPWEGLEKALQSSVGRGTKRSAPEDDEFAAMAAAVPAKRDTTTW